MPASTKFTAPLLLALALILPTAVAVQAQTYPDKAIGFIVPDPAGGGILGNDLVAKSAADGYTVLIGSTTLVQMPHLSPKLPYDVFKDFTPVAQLALSSNLFGAGQPAGQPAAQIHQPGAR